MVRAYPISIEWPPKALAGQPIIDDSRLQVRQMLGHRTDAKLAVGIERFDYTKGIPGPHEGGRRPVMSRPPPGRADASHSFRSRHRHDRSSPATVHWKPRRSLAEDINARHGNGSYQPIRLLVRHHEAGEVFKLFRAADVCIVSSLHDGMNLVAKEFVAARDDENGVLVLSSFTGASRELSEALIVNPYHTKEMSLALDTALRMPAKRTAGADASDAPAGSRVERLSLGRPHADRCGGDPAAPHIRHQRIEPDKVNFSETTGDVFGPRAW